MTIEDVKNTMRESITCLLRSSMLSVQALYAEDGKLVPMEDVAYEAIGLINIGMVQGLATIGHEIRRGDYDPDPNGGN